jgi:ethanolamine-phosphate cytidylyltransferase
MLERMKLYATDASGKAPGAEVHFWTASQEAKSEDAEDERGSFRQLIEGPGPKPGQRVVYVDGGYDLFSSGHIEFLRQVLLEEDEVARKDGWFSEQAVNERKGKGEDYGPAYVVVGVHEDEVINQWKGINYPIMNIFERGLCVLQCKVNKNPTTTTTTPCYPG